jgi:hypothetical protein
MECTRHDGAGELIGNFRIVERRKGCALPTPKGVQPKQPDRLRQAKPEGKAPSNKLPQGDGPSPTSPQSKSLGVERREGCALPTPQGGATQANRIHPSKHPQ